MSLDLNGNILMNDDITSTGVFKSKINTQGLVLYTDSQNINSYTGSGAIWYDLSDKENNGSLTGTSFSSGNMSFNGISDYADFGTSTNLSISTTISVFSWINPDTITNWNGIFGAFDSGSFIHFQQYGNDLNIYVYGPSVGWASLDDCDLQIGVWSYVGFTFNGTILKVYKNAVQFPTQAVASSPNTTINSTSIVSVGRVYSTDKWFDGKINQVTVYDRALNPFEIAENFQADKEKYGL